jgi:hypothetical protein
VADERGQHRNLGKMGLCKLGGGFENECLRFHHEQYLMPLDRSEAAELHC